MPLESVLSGLTPADLAPMIQPAKTALVVIDVQGDFAAPDGAMGKVGVDMSDVEPTIDRIEGLIAAARKAGAALVFARVVTRPETDSTALKLLYVRKGYGEAAVGICRADTPGAAYYRVTPKPGDIEIEKRLFSSFVGTDLEDQLQARGIDTLVFTGLTTDCCVDCTVRDAFHRNYNCFVVDDACSAYGAETHAAAMLGLTKNVALAVTAADVAAAWGAQSHTAMLA
jgi:nicotinamidase-related amidase